MPKTWEKNAARKKFDSLLIQLSDSIGFDDKFEKTGNAAANKIFRTLQGESDYSLNRCIIGGGKGKRTSIQGYTDYDCVVFVNDEEPPFDDVIKEFRSILQRKLGIEAGTTPNSLQFDYDGVSFDLLPATNEVGTHNTDDTAEEQVRKTLAKTRGVPAEKMRYYSSGLTEGAVDFIKTRSLFVHRFIRLCKYWNLGVTASLSGRSTMVETVAVQVAEEEEQRAQHKPIKMANRGRPSLRVAFEKFLQKMRSGDVGVAFYHNYTKNDVPGAMFQQSSYVLDPTNPRNNLLPKGLPASFSTHAKKSLKVFWTSCANIYKRDLELSDIERMF